MENDTFAVASGGLTKTAACECQSVNDALAGEPFFDWSTKPPVVLVFAILYTIVLTIGVTGNVCVLMAVARTRSLRTSSNWFIMALSCSDIGACLISGTVTPITAFRKQCTFVDRQIYNFVN